MLGMFIVDLLEQILSTWRGRIVVLAIFALLLWLIWRAVT